MQFSTFIDNYKIAFGENAALPLVFGYSNQAFGASAKAPGCIFKKLNKARNGEPVSFAPENITCPGGRFYAGFSEMPPFVPDFVSGKEFYKQSAAMVRDFIKDLDVRPAHKPFLNFARMDQAQAFDDFEGLLFFAKPDVLSGLAAWAFYDNNAQDAVCATFGSGCSTIIANAMRENRIGGRRVFIGLFDPSARIYVEPDVLAFVMPACRFKEMSASMPNSCLFNSLAWKQIKERI